MASNLPPSDADDWPLPDDGKTAPDTSGPGSWEKAEEAGDRVGPADQSSQPTAPLQPLIDALRAPFGSLWDDPRSRPLILFSLIALIVVCGMACFVLSLALVDNLGRSPIAATGPTVAPAERQPITEVVRIIINDTPAPIAVPNRLIIRNLTLDVVPVQPDERGEWNVDLAAARVAYWVAGTLVNYIVGLPASDENRTVLESLRRGDLLLLDTAIGTLRYRVSHTATVRVDEPTFLREQSAPQLTLVLIGVRGEERQAIIAGYTDEG
ncbi:MAG: hypothetical protein RMN25_13020, partial [Anaerolineae bacterium]|nr:hypothetical protein [Thermoflexales bacterium]MDW8408694.1 hypothetical protein [Anaerolineae bacterium]